MGSDEDDCLNCGVAVVAKERIYRCGGCLGWVCTACHSGKNPPREQPPRSVPEIVR